jgi:hypothetical protein
MATATVPANLAVALKYGPQTQSSVRRSQYLADALKQLSESGGQIRGGYGELGAKLLAQAILYRAGRKADADAINALKGEQDAETTRWLTALGAAPSPPEPQPAPEPPPLPQAPPQVSAPALAPTADLNDPQVRRLAQLAWHEARGEPPVGQAGVAAVALNRAREAGQPLDQVVFAPHQFTGFTPQRAASIPDAELQKILPNIAPVLQGQDPTGGADHFYNPSLANPSWGQGPGQMIGQHKFLALGYGGGQPARGVDPNMAAGVNPYPPPPPPPDPNGPPVQSAMPSAPGSSPLAAGAPPAALPPQASAAGGLPATMGITAEQRNVLEKLLRDPRTHEAGVAYAMELQKKAAEPIKWDVKVQDGYVIATNPLDPSQSIARPVAELQHHQKSAQSLGIPAPLGTTFDVAPNNQSTKLYEPPTGYQAAPSGQGLGIQPGGPAAVDVERQLRTDFEKSADYQQFSKSATIYNAMKKDFATPGRVADLNFVYGISTIFDPGSVVREGEQIMVRNAQSLPDWLVGAINRVNGGQGLLPEVRAQILETAGQRLSAMQQQVQQRADFNTGMAQRYGIEPKNVIPPMPPFEPFKRPEGMPGPRPEIPAAARQSYQRLFQQGRIDPKQPVGSQANPYQARDEQTLRALDTPANKGMWVLTPNGDLARIE